MKYIQLEFTNLTKDHEELYICNTCNKCINDCKIYSISKSTIVYCKKYKLSK